jgi:hypothetical protein
MTMPWVVAFVALWLVVMLLGLLVLGTLRRLGPVVERSEELLSSAARTLTIGGLPPGATVTPFEAERGDGTAFTSDELLESATAVLFLEPDCSACEDLVNEVDRAHDFPLDVRVVIVSSDRGEAQRLAVQTDATVLVDDDHSIARIFQSVVSPQAFVLDEYGTVKASGTPNQWDELRRLVTTALKGGECAAEVAAANTTP